MKIKKTQRMSSRKQQTESQAKKKLRKNVDSGVCGKEEKKNLNEHSDNAEPLRLSISGFFFS